MAHQRSEPGVYLYRMTRMQTWIAGLATCLLGALALSAIVRFIPASYADSPKQDISSQPAEPGDRLAVSPKANLAAVDETIRRRHSTSCRQCGVVTSIRQPVDDVSGAKPESAKVAGRTSLGTAGTIAIGPIAGRNYEITVRFRDGSTIVVRDSTPGNWRPGMRVIIVAGPNRLTEPLDQ
jgi:hypothetical protein